MKLFDWFPYEDLSLPCAPEYLCVCVCARTRGEQLAQTNSSCEGFSLQPLGPTAVEVVSQKSDNRSKVRETQNHYFFSFIS